MLGLATHEPNFTIIREEFKPNQPKPCDMCGQMGNNFTFYTVNNFNSLLSLSTLFIVITWLISKYHNCL